MELLESFLYDGLFRISTVCITVIGSMKSATCSIAIIRQADAQHKIIISLDNFFVDKFTFILS